MRVKYQTLDGDPISIESNDVTQFVAIDTGGTRIHFLDGDGERFHDVSNQLEQVTRAIFRTLFDRPAHEPVGWVER